MRTVAQDSHPTTLTDPRYYVNGVMANSSCHQHPAWTRLFHRQPLNVELLLAESQRIDEVC